MSLPTELFQASNKTFKSIIQEFVTLKSYKNIEIEARIGRIINKVTRKRIEYNVSHPIVFETCPSDLQFESGVFNEKDFTKIQQLLTGNRDCKKTKDKITVCNNIRRIETLDMEEVVTGVRYEKKDKIKNIDIYLPNYKYDVRVSVSIEKEVKSTEFDVKRNSFIRLRKRESLLHGPFLFDFTLVTKPLEIMAKTWEIELEVKDCEEGIDDFVNIVFNLPLLKN